LRSAVIVRLDGMVIAKLGRQVTPSPARARRARANCRGWRRNRHFAKAQPQGTVLHATSVDDPMPARLGAAELRERGSALLRKSESMPRRESGLAACHSRRYGRYGRSQRHGFSPSTFGGGGEHGESGSTVQGVIRFVTDVARCIPTYRSQIGLVTSPRLGTGRGRLRDDTSHFNWPRRT
jgi:hypothetical protein